MVGYFGEPSFQWMLDFQSDKKFQSPGGTERWLWIARPWNGKSAREVVEAALVESSWSSPKIVGPITPTAYKPTLPIAQTYAPQEVAPDDAQLFEVERVFSRSGEFSVPRVVWDEIGPSSGPVIAQGLVRFQPQAAGKPEPEPAPTDWDRRFRTDGSLVLTNGQRQIWAVQAEKAARDELSLWLSEHLPGNSWGALQSARLPPGDPSVTATPVPGLPTEYFEFDYWGPTKSYPWPESYFGTILKGRIAFKLVGVWKPAKPVGPPLTPEPSWGEKAKEALADAAAEISKVQAGAGVAILGIAAVVIGGLAIYYMPRKSR